jgi:two-component system osmolarity sensor histidine kinase EnvZ
MAKRDKKLSIKSFLPRTLFGRSLLILITPVLLIQIITSFVFFDRHWSKMTTRLAVAVAGEITLIAAEIEHDSSPEALRLLQTQAEEKLSFDISYEPDGVLNLRKWEGSSHVWESMVAKRLNGELRTSLERPYLLDVDFSEKWARVSVQLDNGVLNVSLPQRRLFSSSGYIFLLWMLGTSLVLLLIAILFMRNQIRPIKKLAIAAERFGKGRELTSFKPQGAREVRQAAEAFIGMHKRIRRQMEQRTAMLAGVSHDLRTPLTRLKLQLEMMGDSPDTDAMKSDIQHMEKMIEGYLDFVRGEGSEQFVFTHLNEVIDRVVTSAKRQGLDVERDVTGDIHVNIRAMAFERCLANIISNAGKYAQKIWVSAHADAEEKLVTIIIEDNGPGIPEAQYEDVFRPFYRVDSSRNIDTGGVGLGLPIAMDIVHGHGGKIWLGRSKHGGLLVGISLPQ